jgi:hypothetical protein
MNGFLIDTNVLSEYNRPGGPNAGVKRWLETTDRLSQYVSVITLAEIQKGIELPTASVASNWNSGSSRIWKHGFLAAFFQWIVRLPAAGHRLSYKDCEPADLFRRSIR